MNYVNNFIEKLNITKDENIVVAVSYGPDSMFLLNYLKNKFKDNKIICAHVNHNHRKENDIECDLLSKYCSKNKIIFECMKIDKYKNNNFTENEAREKRYDFFKQILISYNSKYLFTAHHGDDLTETVLMKIVRGSSVKGYSGINLISKRDFYFLVRPLLFLSKEYIVNYVNKNCIPYMVDNTNYSNEYTRNRYRNNILPFLKMESANVHLKFLDFSNDLGEYYNYVENIVLKKYEKIVNNNVINLDLLKQEDKLIIKEILKKYLENNYGKKISKLTKKNLTDVINMTFNNKNNIKLSLPINKILFKSYNKIYFDSNLNYNIYCFELNKKLVLPNGYIIEVVNELDSTNNYITCFLKEEITFPIKVRNKKDGDLMEVLNLNGKKKVKDIFINEKVDHNLRKNYPLLVDNNDNVLWIPGIKKSKYDRSKKGNYDIIFKYYKEEK